MADIIKAYKVSYAPHSESAPTTFTEFKNCIRGLPNFFTDPDTVDTTTIDNTVKTSIPGLSGGEAYGFTVAINDEFLTAHETMVENQTASEKGSFWIEVQLTNRKQKIIMQCTTVTNLPTPEGSAGDLDEITWNVYLQSDPIVSKITTI